MKWNRYTIKTTTEAVDLISCMLAELGIEGIEIQDNVQLTQEEAKTMFVDFIPELPPDDGTAKVNFYIDADEDDNTILGKVEEGLEELRTFVNVGDATVTQPTTKAPETTTKTVETTTKQEIVLDKPFGLVVTSTANNSITVVWGRGTIDLYHT